MILSPEISETQREKLKNNLIQIRQALELGHIDAVYRIISDMEWTLDEME